MSANLNGRLIPVDDTELYAVERGPEGGLPLLVLHGGPGLDHTMFGSHLDALAQDLSARPGRWPRAGP